MDLFFLVSMQVASEKGFFSIIINLQVSSFINMTLNQL
jgi:hypothetical protein